MSSSSLATVAEVVRERERILNLIRRRVKKLREDSENFLLAGDHITARAQLVTARALNSLAHKIEASDEGAGTGDGPGGDRSVLLPPDRRDGEEAPVDASSPKLSDTDPAVQAAESILRSSRNWRQLLGSAAITASDGPAPVAYRGLAEEMVGAARRHIEAELARRMTSDTAIDPAANQLRAIGIMNAREAAYVALAAGSWAVFNPEGQDED